MRDWLGRELQAQFFRVTTRKFRSVLECCKALVVGNLSKEPHEFVATGKDVVAQLPVNLPFAERRDVRDLPINASTDSWIEPDFRVPVPHPVSSRNVGVVSAARRTPQKLVETAEAQQDSLERRVFERVFEACWNLAVVLRREPCALLHQSADLPLDVSREPVENRIRPLGHRADHDSERAADRMVTRRLLRPQLAELIVGNEPD